jgi:hypothetical protein
MILLKVRTAAMAAALVASSAAYAQTSSPSPIIKHPNPASSSSTDEEGLNPLANEGDNSPTGQGPSITTNPPVNSTIGSGAVNQKDETPTSPRQPTGK